MRLRSIALYFLILSVSAFAKRGVTPEDYFAFESANDPRLSPDGRQAAYVVTTVDQKRNRRTSSIWVVATDGRSSPRRLTSKGSSANSPRWSPDGTKLAFLTSRPTDGAAEPPNPQIHVLPMDGGEAHPVSHLKNAVTVFQWAPDGRRFVAVSRNGPSDAVPPAERKSDVRHYTHITYKFNDTGWYDDKRSHLWI